MLTQAQVGRFEIREFLGRGAIGDVYLAWDPEAGSEVALKLVRTGITDAEMLAAERNGTLLQSALARVAPQVAAVYGQGEQDGFFWVAMEFVAGDDLAAVIQREGAFPPHRAVDIALQLCRMLETFHEFSTGSDGRKGIVHGDLKPENIRLQRLQDGDRVRVLDFGIAKHLSQTRRFTVNLFGSLPYTPPERLNSGRLDAQSDLWAVGVILYILLAGYPPYSGTDPEELEGRIRRGDPPAPLPEGCPLDLQRVLARALAFEPEQRYPSAAALAADLEAWRDGRPVAPETAALAAIAATAAERAPQADLGATRRTGRTLDDSWAALGETRRTERPAGGDLGDGGDSGDSLDATRRTWEPGALPPPPAHPAPDLLGSVPGPQPVAARRGRRARKLWLAVLGALLVAFGLAQFWVQSEAVELQRALVTDTDPDLLAILDRYRHISWLGIFNPTVGEVREELRESLVSAADRLIDDYHAEYPQIRERGWQQANEYLRGAMELKLLDRKVRARLLYTQGHLDRIAAQTLRGRGQRQEANTRLDAAVDAYRDAARRNKDWPDPYLGLARVYAYERPDLERLQQALAELERRGYRLGRRERAMEGDVYRMRGEQLWRQAQGRRGSGGETEQEVDLLERARDNLLQAINFYEDSQGYGNVRANQAQAARRLSEVQARLRELESPTFAPDLLREIEDIFGIEIPGEGRR